MSYDHWKTTNPDDEELGSAQQTPYQDEDENLAAMLDVTLDEYYANKSLDRWLHRYSIDENDELPF
jgi:hypothetical protein